MPEPRYPIIPFPKYLQEKEGSFSASELILISEQMSEPWLQSIVDSIEGWIKKETDGRIPLRKETSNKGRVEKITVEFLPQTTESWDIGAKDESYQLSISPVEVHIKSNSTAGYFYAAQTIIQLLTFEERKGKLLLPCCEIRDSPAFPFRGFMHDVGRNFISLERLKRQMQFFAQYKINVFHWHLTDNPAWRIECRVYPELNDPKYHPVTRNPGKYYSFQEIHEFIAFCKSLQITVIPELDVPGHSKYFRRAMKTPMYSRKGMKILTALFEEFFAEFSREEFPYIHIGSDEIHIPNPRQFIRKMAKIVQDAGRDIILWNPGLEPPKGAIVHNWGNYKSIDRRRIDSKSYYLNNMNLFPGIIRIFYTQPCQENSYKTSNGKALGATMCLWPDVNVEHEVTTEKYNFLYPGIITFAERAWLGNNNFNQNYLGRLPTCNEKDLNLFEEFEGRLIHQRDRLSRDFFFPYVKQSRIQWSVIGPFSADFHPIASESPEMVVKSTYQDGEKNLVWQTHIGATLNLNVRNGFSQLLPQVKKGVAYALTYINSPRVQEIQAWIGFESPGRANRQYSGIPKEGKWDANGGEIWVNNAPLPTPEWENPGRNFYPKRTSWHKPIQEVPFIDEEFFWTRPPTSIQLESGWNKLLVKIPKVYPDQSWSFTFAPISFTEGRFKERRNLRFSADIIHETQLVR